MVDFKVSTRKNKKYMVKVGNKWVHFGAIVNGKPMGQFKDITGLGVYSKYDHGDKKRRDAYRARHKAIKLKDGTPAYKNKKSGSYWSWKYLW